MQRPSVFTSMLAVLSLALSAGVAFGQPAPPGPTTVSEDRFPAADVPGPIEVVHVVLDFAPGAGVPAHTHGGQVFITVVEGALTLSEGGSEKAYRAGETTVEEPGHFYTATNAGSGNTRLFATYVLPKGAPLTTVQEGAAVPAVAPATVALGRFDIAAMPARFEVVQVLLDLPAGAWTPLHSHGGPVLATVLEGEVTERRAGVERRLGPGQRWTEDPGDRHTVGNDGTTTARLAATILLPRGAELTTVHEAVAAPGPAPAPAQVPRSR
jgi:quercetin dioxygenase-like cupin family protein